MVYNSTIPFFNVMKIHKCTLKIIPPQINILSHSNVLILCKVHIRKSVNVYIPVTRKLTNHTLQTTHYRYYVFITNFNAYEIPG